LTIFSQADFHVSGIPETGKRNFLPITAATVKVPLIRKISANTTHPLLTLSPPDAAGRPVFVDFAPLADGENPDHSGFAIELVNV
jgi:hypothetical protein